MAATCLSVMIDGHSGPSGPLAARAPQSPRLAFQNFRAPRTESEIQGGESRESGGRESEGEGARGPRLTQAEPRAPGLNFMNRPQNAAVAIFDDGVVDDG